MSTHVSAGTGEQPFANSVTAGSASGGWRLPIFVFALVELAVIYAPTMQWLYQRWTLSVWHNAHGLLIPPVVAYFVYQELSRFKGRPREASPWGLAIVVPALALHALDTGMHTQLLSAVSLVLLLPGLSLLVWGVERTRAILFPLAFMAFALPIPLVFTERIHLELREIATMASGAVLPMLGIPVLIEDTTLHLPPGALIISDACSGFSTLYAALALACLTAYSSASTPRRVLVLLAAAPLAIAANILRVILLVVMVMWQGAGVLDTFIHPLSGMMTFALALPIIFWLGGDVSRPQPAVRA